MRGLSLMGLNAAARVRESSFGGRTREQPKQTGIRLVAVIKAANLNNQLQQNTLHDRCLANHHSMAVYTHLVRRWHPAR